MSVITTRTSVLSILKVGNSKASQRQVNFSLPTNIRQIFINQKKSKAKSGDYESLVCTLRDSEISDQELLKLLTEATKCIGLLDYELRLFVQALVILGWTHRSQVVIQVYQDFILSVLSAHPQHSKDVIDHLVKLFMSCEIEQWSDDVSPSEIDQEVFAHIHKMLKSIIYTIPLTTDILLSVLRSNFPYHTQVPCKQQAYMYNVLKIVEYLPSQRKVLLSLIVDRLLNLDVHAPREDILENYQEQFEMDDITPVSNDLINVTTALDSGMVLLFRFIDSVCKVNGELQLMETKSLFNDFLEILDKCLLSTYGSHHVQFIMFYFVSFKTALAQNFLTWLWHKVQKPSVPEVIRRMAVGHMASFLTRANFIPSGFLKSNLDQMCTWLMDYLKQQDNNLEPNREMLAHSVFYGVCQAVFYLIAFRHVDFSDSKKKLAFLQSLNLAKIVGCPLNPLRYCDATIVEKFAAVAKELEIVYCYTIIEKNSKGFLKTSIPDPFFPYDNYVLKLSKCYITPLYREYDDSPINDIDIAEMMEMDTEELIDEFIADVAEKDFHPVSI